MVGLTDYRVQHPGDIGSILVLRSRTPPPPHRTLLEQCGQPVSATDDIAMRVVGEIVGAIVPAEHITIAITRGLPRPFGRDLTDDGAGTGRAGTLL